MKRAKAKAKGERQKGSYKLQGRQEEGKGSSVSSRGGSKEEGSGKGGEGRAGGRGEASSKITSWREDVI